MNYSESMSKRQQRRKALNQRFRRMFLVALLMGLAMGFIFGRCSAVNGKAPDAPIEPDQLTAVTPDVTLEPVETPLVKKPPNLNRCCWAVSELPPIVPVKSVAVNGPRTGPTALCMVPLVWN